MALGVGVYRPFLAFALGSRLVSAQVFVGSDGSYAGQLGTPPNLSASCAATFSQPVVCAPMLWQVSQNVVPDATDIELICNPDCLSGLQELQKTQRAQCTKADNITRGDMVYPATYITDLLLYTYHWACLKNSEGDLCLPLFLQYNNASDAGPSTKLCTECNLRTWQAVLDSPLGYNGGLAAEYSSLTSSCQVTSYPATSPTVQYALGTTNMAPIPIPTDPRVPPTYTCESTYTIQESDTCVSISMAKQVSTLSLLQANRLGAFCSYFPGPGTELCIPQRCNTYKVNPWDTCATLAQSNGLTIAQLVEYNPNLNLQCGNLRSLVGYVICLSALGTVTTQSPKPKPTTTSYLANPCLNPGAPSSCFATSWKTPESVIPWPTVTINVSATTTRRQALPAWTDPASLPRAPGTWDNCTRYDIYRDDVGPIYCFQLEDLWGCNKTQVLKWNPSLPSYNETTLESCQYEKGYSYCVKI